MIIFALLFFPSFCNSLFHFACKPVDSVLYSRGNKTGVTEVEKMDSFSVTWSAQGGVVQPDLAEEPRGLPGYAYTRFAKPYQNPWFWGLFFLFVCF